MSSFLNDTWFKQRPEYLDALDERLKPVEKFVVRKLFERTMRRGEYPEDDQDLLTQMLGISPGAWKKYRESLMFKKKIAIQDGCIVLMGSEELLAEHLESREKFRKRAVAGGYAKAAKDKKANDINDSTMLEACFNLCRKRNRKQRKRKKGVLLRSKRQSGRDTSFS